MPSMSLQDFQWNKELETTKIPSINLQKCTVLYNYKPLKFLPIPSKSLQWNKQL